jgi:hypothetical protein
LWDTRKFSAFRSIIPEVGENGLVQDYNKHQCSSYNITGVFFNSERNIITGKLGPTKDI